MSGAGEQALVRLKAWLTVTVGIAGGLLYGPLIVRAALVAVLVAVIGIYGLAHAHDMSVPRATALYGGRAIVAVLKATAIGLVEWPLRGAHRVWVRLEAPLRLQLAAARTADRALRRPRELRAPTDAGAPRAEVLALSTAHPSAPAQAAELLAPSRCHEGTTAA